MNTQCKSEALLFQTQSRRELLAHFNGGNICSDAGGQPEGGCRLAYAGKRQESFDGLLYGQGRVTQIMLLPTRQLGQPSR